MKHGGDFLISFACDYLVFMAVAVYGSMSRNACIN